VHSPTCQKRRRNCSCHQITTGFLGEDTYPIRAQ